MADHIDVSLSGADPSWSATITPLAELAPTTATGATAEGALEAARTGALAAILAYCDAQGQAVDATALAALEARLRSACSVALASLAGLLPTETLPTWGSDVSTFPHLDPTLTPISSARVVAEAVARRLLTPLGGLFYDPSSGMDVRELLSAGLTPQETYSLQSRLASEAEADERVQSADVVLVLEPATQSLRLTVSLELVDGRSFDLVLAVSQLAVDLSVLSLA